MPVRIPMNIVFVGTNNTEDLSIPPLLPVLDIPTCPLPATPRPPLKKYQIRN